MLNFIKHYKKTFLCIVSFLTVSLLLVSTVFSLKSTKQELPVNPLKDVATGSQLVLLNNSTGQNISPIKVDKQIDSTITQKEDNENSDDEGSQFEDKDDSSDSDNENKSNNVPKSPSDVSQVPKNKDKSDSSSSSPSYNPNLEIPDDNTSSKAEASKYFSTSIKNNSTVTVGDYNFTITHKNPRLEMVDHVILNGAEVADFSGNIKLKRGKNSIKVSVDIKDSDGKKLTVSQLYYLYFYDDRIVVYTDLKSKQESDKDTFSFYAYAKYNTSDVDVKVLANDSEVSKKNDSQNDYSVNLIEGDNKIIIAAYGDNGKTISKTYHINYIVKHANLKFETDLKDTKTYSSTLNFRAKALDTLDSDNETPLTVKVNGSSIEPTSGSNYKANLKEGTNSIELSSSKYKDTLTKTFTVTYTKPIGGGGNTSAPENKNKPKIFIMHNGLVENETVIGTTKNFSLYALDYKGDYITSGNFDIKCNGKSVKLIWANTEQTSYRATLINGKNTITIGVKDKEGNFNNLLINLNCKIVPEGEVIGNATFSLEASVLGIPYIIKPTEIEIHQGENAAKILDRLLKQNNFTYDMTGNLESNFYLARVNFNKDIITSPKIPNDLSQHLTSQGFEIYSDDADPQSLGEFDYTHGSGWMYSINGLYPNYGFADAYLKPGDKVRIRFTLAYGADIGGADALGSGGGNWGKEW